MYIYVIFINQKLFLNNLSFFFPFISDEKIHLYDVHIHQQKFRILSNCFIYFSDKKIQFYDGVTGEPNGDICDAHAGMYFLIPYYLFRIKIYIFCNFRF